MTPKVNVDILVVKGNKVLLGLLTSKWNYKQKQVYGVPGRDIKFGESIGTTVKRDVKKDLGCTVKSYKVFCVNANYALENHYIGIGVVADIDGEPKNLIPEDWVRWEWFNTNSLPKNLFPATKNLVESYFTNKINVCE